MMNPDRIEDYVKKVYGYAIKHTYSRDEADELSQEILFTAIRELPKLREDAKFEPWLWGVAANVTKRFRRSMGKQRAMYAYDALSENDLIYEDTDSEQEALYDLLRTKIAMLSAIYRDILILYYYDGLSTKQISEKLNIPEGTVTWRLSEARRKLKKEYAEMNETALRPKKMSLDIYGSGNYDGKTIPFPSVYMDDALSQNILYYCYEQANSVEALSKLCGVPAYYIEERLENLVRREAMIEVSKGKYQTDFLIWSDKYAIYCEENAEKALRPVMNDLLAALKGIAAEASALDFYKAGMQEKDLFYLYGAMAFDFASRQYCKLPYPKIKPKYDGHEWCYLGNMESGKHHRIRLGTQQCTNSCVRGKYTHISFSSISGVDFRPIMNGFQLDVCGDILREGSSEDTEWVADAIQHGYIEKHLEDCLSVTVPAFTAAQKGAFDTIADHYLAPLMPAYSECVNRFLAGYKKLFPKHLSEDADRMCQGMFAGMYTVLIEYAQRNRLIEMPSPHCPCDVILQGK